MYLSELIVEVVFSLGGRHCGEREVGVHGITNELGTSSHSHKRYLPGWRAGVVSRAVVVWVRLCISAGTPHLASVRVARDLHRFCVLRSCEYRFLM